MRRSGRRSDGRPRGTRHLRSVRVMGGSAARRRSRSPSDYQALVQLMKEVTMSCQSQFKMLSSLVASGVLITWMAGAGCSSQGNDQYAWEGSQGNTKAVQASDTNKTAAPGESRVA